MSSHYRFYDNMGDVIPFNARYSYPTQANRARKSNIKIGTKNGNTFRSDQATAPIVIELPAQGYLDTRNSKLTFDLQLFANSAVEVNAVVQNNVQSIFRRVRFVYGSLVCEDLREYNVLTRLLTEGAGTNTTGIVDQTAIMEGIGGTRPFYTFPPDHNVTFQMGNVRAMDVQIGNPSQADVDYHGAIIDGPRRYCVQFTLGLFQQPKLLPLKWMASQVRIELELAPWASCICSRRINLGTGYTPGYYEVSNMTFDAELLEFDLTYDAALIEGLNNDGVPIKFASWNTYLATPSPSQTQTIQIPERNRSLKAIFAVMLPPERATFDVASSGTVGEPMDSHAFLNSSGSGFYTNSPWTTGFCKDFQFRIGGKYYPAQPVYNGSTVPNGAAESYFELQKALNIVGDYRLSTGIHPARWCFMEGGSANDSQPASMLADWGQWVDGMPDARKDLANYTMNGPSCFIIAADLETSNGSEISGLNDEEQNDIALVINYSEPQSSAARFMIFVYYDALMVLRENNLVELIK